jgi:serine/threonine protein phosphatase PrpC
MSSLEGVGPSVPDDPPIRVRHGRGFDVRAGFASETGRRSENQDFGCVLLEPEPGLVIAAIADGVGGALGGRVAAELAVRSFLEGLLDEPAELPVDARGRRALAATNRWIHGQSQLDPALAHMATTFTALIVAGREARFLHVGDTRLYRFDAGSVNQVTEDHVVDRAGLRHVLRRAVGPTPEIQADAGALPLGIGDRFLLCSDGIHASLAPARLAQLLALPVTPEECARLLVLEALIAGSGDNVTAIVLDIVDLPTVEGHAAVDVVARLELGPVPRAGELIDGYRIGPMLADTRATRLFRATDTRDGRAVVLKLPKPGGDADGAMLRSFVRETRIATLAASPWLGVPIDVGTRRTRLYTAMPYFDGETLAVRLRRFPYLRLSEGVAIAIKLAKGLSVLHRRGILHRDIKPENVILEPGGGLKLIDFGSAWFADEDRGDAPDFVGTPSYVAPELFAGGSADIATDLYALGVTLYTAFAAGAYPYGEVEPFMRPVFGRPIPVTRHRPDLPTWLDAALLRLVAVDPAQRYGDVLALLLDLETGLSRVPAPAPVRQPLYQRNPTRFWQIVSVILVIALLWALHRG